MIFYLDASVLVPIVVSEPTSEISRAWLEQQNVTFRVGRLAIGEVGSAVSRRRRMGDLTDDQGERALDLFDTWIRAFAIVVDHDPNDFNDAALWVRRPHPKLLTPDALHLATCRRINACLVTADLDLTIVARLLRIDFRVPA